MSRGSWCDELRDDLRVALPPYLAARAIVGLAWVLARAVADRYDAVRPVQIGEGLLAWDGTWYRDIAQFGYHGVPVQGVRFFPLYALLGKLLGFGGGASVSLVVIANVAALALAIVVRRLVRFETGDSAASDRATWAICLFPSAFVLVWAYSESLMLLAATGAFLSARKGRWWWAAACGLAAGAARPVGMAVAVAMAIEAARGIRRSQRWDGWIARLAAIVAPIAGAGAYLLWVEWQFGSWSLPFRVQEDLRGQGANPVTRVVQGIGDMFGVERFGDGLHVPFAIAFVVLLVVTFRRWPSSYGAYASVVLLAAVSASNLNSVERYALNAFPIVLTLALLLRTPRWERLGLAVCGAGMLALSSLAWLAIYVP